MFGRLRDVDGPALDHVQRVGGITLEKDRLVGIVAVQCDRTPDKIEGLRLYITKEFAMPHLSRESPLPVDSDDLLIQARREPLELLDDHPSALHDQAVGSCHN